MSSNFFSTQHLLSDLTRRSVRGGAATFAAQAVKFVLSLGSTMILARALSPQDFGLIAMVTAVTGFIMIFKDLGLSTATVQRAEINHAQVSTLFWVNVALSIVLMGTTVALAPTIAWFFDDERLVSVTYVLASSFLLAGITVQHQALLRRQMRFATLMVIDILSMSIGITTAIICAWSGLGYWSLVWMPIATAATNACAVWVVCGWIPGVPVRHSGVRSMIAFGGYLTGFGFVNYFARNLDNILIGKVSGAGALGLYSRAYSVLMLPIAQIVAPMTSVAVPALSRLQDDPVKYRDFYLSALNLIAYLTFPFVIALAVLSTEVVAVVLGDKWMSSVPIFRALAITAMFQPIVSTVGWLYISLGHTRRMAHWGLISSALISIAFMIGIRWGALGVAISYAIAQLLLVYPSFAVATARTCLKPADVFRVSYRPFLLSLCVGTGMLGGRLMLSGAEPLALTVVLLLFSGLLACLIALWLWPAARADLARLAAAVPMLVRSNGRA